MDNFHFIQQATREELIIIINLLINEGSNMIANELWDVTHIVDHGNNYDEVQAWLKLDTLDYRFHKSANESIL